MSICKQVIEHFTAPDLWEMPIKTSNEITLQMAQNDIAHYCLLLEGFGVIAKILQEDYQYFLLKTLYLIIEKAGEYLIKLNILNQSHKNNLFSNSQEAITLYFVLLDFLLSKK